MFSFTYLISVRHCSIYIFQFCPFLDSWYVLISYKKDLIWELLKNHDKIFIMINDYLWQKCQTVTKSVVQRCSLKKVLLEISQNSQKNNSARDSRPEACNFVKKVSGTGVFLWISRNFWEHLFYGTHPVATSVVINVLI